ncbi:MAG: ATP-binding protein [Alphaproteobacteria bacterium]
MSVATNRAKRHDGGAQAPLHQKNPAAPSGDAVSEGAHAAASATAPGNDERLHDFTRFASDWFFETDAALRFTYLSDRFEELTGIARAEALGRTLLDLAGADLRHTHWQRHIEDVLAQRPYRDFAFATKFGFAEERHYRVSGAPWLKAGGFMGYRGAGSDVTEMERDHKNLVAVKGRLEHLLDTSPAMIYSFKASDDYAATFASGNIRRQLGHDPAEFLKDPAFWTKHIHPEDEPRVIAELGILFKKGHHVQEYRFRHKNGEYLWMRDELVLVKDDDGTPMEVVGYWVDITDRKRAEEAVKEYAAKLERSNRELQDFAYVASHDLQEPLRKIEAFGDRLKAKCSDSLSDDGRMYLERMQHAATRMRTLINDLLTYSRVTTKAQPFVATDLAKVFADVVSDLNVAIEKSGGRVEAGGLPTIDADTTQMRQLFQNLIANALKFHRPDVPPVISISAELVVGDDTASPGAGRCVIRVADNGIGFDQKYVDRIFNMFERLHGRGEYEGTGIGLATCRKIVERHGGTIVAQSAPNEGATFTITLPARQHAKEQPS